MTKFASPIILLFFVMNSALSQNNSTDNITKEIAFPLRIEIDPMEKLLLVNFEKDADSIYIGFEPQVFNDEINGVGHLIIGWRKDKKVDVYHQKSLNPNPANYNIAGEGLNKLIPVEMEKAYFEINENGVQAHYTFFDLSGRKVKIAINENNTAKRKPFGILAPMGDAATNPSSLPLIFLEDFYFVRSDFSDIRISIDNNNHQPDMLPLPIDGSKMTFTRYSAKPLIATVNPSQHDNVSIIEAEIGQETIIQGDFIYEIEWKNQSAAIKSMTVHHETKTLNMTFNPAFPCLNTLKEESNVSGKFRIYGHDSLGSVSGIYRIKTLNEGIHVTMIPSKGWKPKVTKFTTGFLFTVARVFKKWPTTYQWDATLKQNTESGWELKSDWTRNGRIIKNN